jgi:DNA-binding MarR family transcriptional regulator
MIGGSKPPEALGEYTGFLLTWVAARGRDQFATAMAELDLRPPHFALLTVIGAHPGATQQELVEATGIDPSTMVQIIDALEAAGLAERRMHASDRRKRAVHLTAAGEERLRDARAAAQDAADDLFGALDAAERRELHGMLRRLAGLEEQAKSPADRAPH